MGLGLIKEFREFAVRGNVIDLAVGVIIGAAFSKIVTSLVDDLIMPPLGYITGGIDFSSKKWVITAADPANEIAEVSVKYGNFINTVIQFFIVAFCIFLLVKFMNRIRRKEEDKPVAPAPPSNQEVLLTEIRDILRRQER